MAAIMCMAIIWAMVEKVQASAVMLCLCRRCPDGTFALPGASECTPCPAGTFTNNFEDLDHNGYTKDDPALSLCYQCPVGYYTPRPGMARCLPCTAGYVSRALRSTQCTACPKGTLSMERIGANADADLQAVSDAVIAGDDFDEGANTPWLDTQMSAQATCSLVPQGAVHMGQAWFSGLPSRTHGLQAKTMLDTHATMACSERAHDKQQHTSGTYLQKAALITHRQAQPSRCLCRKRPACWTLLACAAILLTALACNCWPLPAVAGCCFRLLR